MIPSAEDVSRAPQFDGQYWPFFWLFSKRSGEMLKPSLCWPRIRWPVRSTTSVRHDRTSSCTRLRSRHPCRRVECSSIPSTHPISAIGAESLCLLFEPNYCSPNSWRHNRPLLQRTPVYSPRRNTQEHADRSITSRPQDSYREEPSRRRLPGHGSRPSNDHLDKGLTDWPRPGRPSVTAIQ